MPVAPASRPILSLKFAHDKAAKHAAPELKLVAGTDVIPEEAPVSFAAADARPLIQTLSFIVDQPGFEPQQQPARFQSISVMPQLRW